jgi:drug/metabolite transporter (DMT)-like permease
MERSSRAALVDAPSIGVAFILGSLLLYAFSDAAAKFLTVELHVAQVIWCRLTFQALAIAAVIAVRRSGRLLATKRIGLHLLRGAMTLSMVAAFYTGLAFVPLADAVAVTLSAPLFVTALSAVVLGERVGPRRWTAVTVGLVGALIVIRPGLGVVHWAAALPLLAAACYSVLALVTRVLSRTEGPHAMMFYSATSAALLASLAAPLVWTAPTAEAWGVIVVMGALGAAGDLTMIAALRRAQASLIAPFIYVQLLWSVILGYLVFGDIPDRWTWLGALVIVGGGLYLMYRERVLERAARGA